MFKNPIDPKMRKTSSNFKAPTKENATTGRFMDAGDNYGVGFKNPVGKDNASSNGPIPMKSFCMDPNEMKFRD